MQPVTLAGTIVTLEPLSLDHHDGLVAAASDGPGTTTYCNINAATPKVEIGYTWNRASTRGRSLRVDARNSG